MHAFDLTQADLLSGSLLRKRSESPEKAVQVLVRESTYSTPSIARPTDSTIEKVMKPYTHSGVLQYMGTVVVK